MEGSLEMGNRLVGNPYEYIDEILKIPSKKRVSEEGNRTEKFWDTHCPSDAFLPHPDARQSILYKPRNK